jgi:hypothetical protein
MGVWFTVARWPITQVVFLFMTKEEVYTQLKVTKELHTANRGSKLWKEAFSLYEKATGVKLDLGCNKCFQRVLDWLNEG